MITNPIPVVQLDAAIPSFLTPALWQHVIDTLNLSPQQARIVSLILRGRQDKDIASELGLNRYTIRTYMRRVFDRVGVGDRMQLVLRVFAMCVHECRRQVRRQPVG